MKNKQQFILTCTIFLLVFNINLQAQSVVLSSPSSSSTYVDSAVITYSVSEPAGAPQAIYIVLTPTSGPAFLAGTGPVTLTMKPTYNVSGSKTFTLSFTDLTNANNHFTASPSTVMLEGSYSAYCQYVRPASTGGTTLKSTTRTNTLFDVNTQTPTLASPAASSSSSSTVAVAYSLKEGYLSSSAKLIFTNLSDASVNEFNLADYLLNPTFSFSTTSISAPGFISSSTSTTLPDGNYSVTLSYRDRFSHPVSSVTNNNFLIQTSTPTPLLTLPLSNSALKRLLNFKFTLPSHPASGSVKLKFTKNSQTEIVVLKNINSGTLIDLTLDSKNFTSSSFVDSATVNELTNGIYDISLEYQDFLNNPANTVSISNVEIDNATIPAIITAPVNNLVVSKGQTFNLDFILPEMSLQNSVFAELNNSNVNCNIGFNFTFSGNKSIQIDPKNIVVNSNTVSTSHASLPDGTYSLKIKYRDVLGNEIAYSEPNTLIIDTITDLSTLILPGDNSSNISTVNLSFNLPEVALNNTANLKFIGNETIDIVLQVNNPGLKTFSLIGSDLLTTTNLVSSSKDFIPNGIYTLVLSYKDANGNDNSYSVQNNVTFSGVLTNPIITTQNITLSCNQEVNLSSAVTSNTDGLILSYYSDAALTNTILNRVTTAGTYYIKVTDSNNLYSSTSVIVNAGSVFSLVPTVTTLDNILVSSETNGNQWYNINGQILGATNQYFVPTQNSNYYVIVTQSGCTSSVSNVIEGRIPERVDLVNKYGGIKSSNITTNGRNVLYPPLLLGTTVVTNITSNTATSGGNVLNDGGSPVTYRGVCWSTSNNPTISDSKTINANGTGNFTSNLVGLTPSTTYYVRAYATNSIGTTYGNQTIFTSN